MMNFVVIGAGGHAKVVIEAIRAMNARVVGVVDKAAEGSDILGAPFLGDDSVLPELRRNGLCHIGLGVGDNALRERLGKRARDLGFALPPIIHPSAFLSPSAHLSAGVVVMARAVVGVQTILREMALVNTGAILDHDNDLGVSAHVAPGSALAGNVRVGDRALIGVGSSIRPGISVGVDAIVGAGSVVVRDVGDRERVGGTPARPLVRKITK